MDERSIEDAFRAGFKAGFAITRSGFNQDYALETAAPLDLYLAIDIDDDPEAFLAKAEDVLLAQYRDGSLDLAKLKGR